MTARASAMDLAITVDDLPPCSDTSFNVSSLKRTEQFISAFKKFKVPGVYGFVNGKNLKICPESSQSLREWRRAGYLLGNHTYSHLDLSRNSATSFENDILKNEDVLSSLESATIYKWFRFPYLIEGDNLQKREQVRDYLFQNQYRIAQVTVDFGGSSWNEPYLRCLRNSGPSARASSIRRLRSLYLQAALLELRRSDLLGREIAGRSVKQILILHPTVFEADMIGRLLLLFKLSGVKFVSLPEAARDPIYAADPKLVENFGRTFLHQMMVRGHYSYPMPQSVFNLEKLNHICQN